MAFLALIFKNLLRQKVRTLLTILGIGIGIATIVALLSISDGFKRSAENELTKSGADLTIFEANVSDAIFSQLPEKKSRLKLKSIKEIRKLSSVVYAVAPIRKNPFFIILGLNPEEFTMKSVNILKGRKLTLKDRNKIMLGKIAHDNLKKGIGEEISVGNKKYEIVGIFEVGIVYYDGGAILPLSEAQKIAKKEGTVNAFQVKLKPGSDIEKVGKAIETKFPEMAVVKSVEDYSKIDQGLRITDAAAWIISLLAIVVGGIGVMNTMIMSVYERTREIGILRAVGWRRWRVLAMILGESFLLAIVASIVGSLLGVIAVQFLLQFPVVKGLIEPIYSTNLFLKALIVALAVGLAGGLYPAYRAVRILPMEALRYE